MRRILSALIILTLGSFVVLTSSSASADTSATATATVTVGSACTLNSVLNTPHTATIPSGTNQSEIGKTTFTVVCNNTGGYSIYAIGYSNFEIGNTKLLATVNGALNSNYDINTGTNASGTPSSWAMKLTPSTNLTASNILNGFGSYSAVPSSYTKVATLIPTTTMVNTSSLEATYRVNIASTQPAGNYNGKVRYVMVDPNTNVPNEPKTCAANKICYWPNAGSEVVDSMGDQSITSSATSDTLWPSNFQRDGYGFAGWSDKYDWELNANDANGNGTGVNEGYHIYGPMADIEFTAGQYSNTNGGLSLYAVWIKSEGYLQGWNGCSALGSGKITALSDQRDGDTYAVAKLADGNCWMIENLRLDADDSKDSSLAQGFGGVFAGLANPETTNFTASSSSDTEPTTANSLYYAGTQSGTATIDILQENYAGYRIPRYNNNNTNSDTSINPNTTVTNMTGPNQNVYSYGNYYTWHAAIANTTHYSGTSSTDANGKTSETVGTSLCPNGWKLPYGRDTGNGASSGSFYYLNYKINNDTDNRNSSMVIRGYPNNFVKAGYYKDSSVRDRRLFGWGQYWSTTVSATNSVYSLAFHTELLYPAVSTTNDKSDALSVRCLAQ